MSASEFALLFFIGFLIGLLSRLLYARMTGKLRAEDFKNPKNVRYIDTKKNEESESDQQERKAG